MPSPHDRRRWAFALAAAILFLGFAAVWTLSWLLFGLGTCGEDSDITAAEYARLCEPGGEIDRNLSVIAAAAVIATGGLGAAAIRRRAARPVILLAVLLTVGAAASLAADSL